MRRLITVLLLTCATSVFGAAPAAFVKIGGIAGESQEYDHFKWFQLVSFDQGPFRWTQKDGNGNFLPGKSGMEGAGKMTVTRLAKAGAPDVYRAALNGTFFGTVELDVPIKTEMGEKFIRWTLSDVVITGINVERPHLRRGVPFEQITFTFQRAEWDRPDSPREVKSISPQRPRTHRR